VARTRESLLLNKAVQDENFNHDPYVQKHQPQSVLCLPAIHQGKFLGVVYLEHRQAVQAFTPGRVELVNLLIVQMAVSIDNAILYRSLEEKVKERTLIIEEQKKELEKEKQKSDRLLYNILPASTAEELKETGKATPKSFESVTVLFTDFTGFTRIVERISPEELINTLNEVFVTFDEISKKYRLEPIKTIGDSFMCAGGIPEVNNTHPSDAVYAGLEMQEFIVQWNLKRVSNGLERLDLRLGIHTGPVIAGVIGMRKFAYDIWGDAVNVASRLESSGVPGEVNISHATHKLVSDLFLCESRGKIHAKHKGEIEMYLVKRIL
jgi:class 3 adenylate cyclase